MHRLPMAYRHLKDIYSFSYISSDILLKFAGQLLNVRQNIVKETAKERSIWYTDRIVALKYNFCQLCQEDLFWAIFFSIFFVKLD